MKREVNQFNTYKEFPRLTSKIPEVQQFPDELFLVPVSTGAPSSNSDLQIFRPPTGEQAAMKPFDVPKQNVFRIE